MEECLGDILIRILLKEHFKLGSVDEELFYRECRFVMIRIFKRIRFRRTKLIVEDSSHFQVQKD